MGRVQCDLYKGVGLGRGYSVTCIRGRCGERVQCDLY